MLKAWNPVSHKVCQVGVLGWTRTAVHSRPRIFAVHKLLLKSIRRAVVWLSVYLLFSEEKLAFLCVCLFGSSYLQWGGVRHPTHRRPRWWRNREVGRWAREIKRSNRPTWHRKAAVMKPLASVCVWLLFVLSVSYEFIMVVKNLYLVFCKKETMHAVLGNRLNGLPEKKASLFTFPFTLSIREHRVRYCFNQCCLVQWCCLLSLGRAIRTSTFVV